MAVKPAVAGVQAFNGIRGADDFSDILREGGRHYLFDSCKIVSFYKQAPVFILPQCLLFRNFQKDFLRV